MIPRSLSTALPLIAALASSCSEVPEDTTAMSCDQLRTRITQITEGRLKGVSMEDRMWQEALRKENLKKLKALQKDKQCKAEPTTITDAGTDAEADAEADNACKLPPLDPELQKLAEGHKVKVGYHDQDGEVIYKELTLDEITGKNSILPGCEDGREEMLWSFIKHTRDQKDLQLQAVIRMTSSHYTLGPLLVSAEAMEEYKKKTVIVMEPILIQ